MEACATAHGWGREFEKLGHDVRLIAPIYVKPFVKRQKNDAGDAEAIVDAALRPTMRFVAVKTEDQKARDAVPDTAHLCQPTHSDDQHLAWALRRARAGGGTRSSPCQATRRRARR